MKAPKCKLVADAARYRTKAVRSIRYDGEERTIDIQGEGFAFARVVFRQPAGFDGANWEVAAKAYNDCRK